MYFCKALLSSLLCCAVERSFVNTMQHTSVVENKEVTSKEKRFQNCLVCVFRPAFYFGYTGITAIKFSCDHSQRPVSFSLERSWLSTGISACLFVSNVAVGFLNVNALFEDREDIRNNFLLVSTIAIHFLAAYLFSIGATVPKKKINELRGIAEITKYCETAGFILFEESFVRMAHNVTYTFIISFVLLEVFSITHFALKGEFSCNAFLILCTKTCIFMQGTVSTHYMLLQLVLLNMFQRILAEIKITVENRLNNKDIKTDLTVKADQNVSRSFVARIQQLRRIYESAYLNFIEIDNLMNPAFLIWWNMILSINVVCAYVFLNSIVFQKPLDLEQLLYILQHCGTLIGLIIFLIMMEFIADVVSYLFI